MSSTHHVTTISDSAFADTVRVYTFRLVTFTYNLAAKIGKLSM